jgi:hypothetical protein
MHVLRHSFLAACLGILAAAPGVAAQGSTLAFTFHVKVHEGQERAFEAAMKEHMAVRQEAGEPFQWSVYQSMFGDDGGDYYIRSAGHSWADLDTYGGMSDVQEEIENHFAETMTPFIAESASWVSSMDTTMSTLPPDMEAMNVFMVTRVSVDAEGAMAMEEALGSFHETAAAHDMYHIMLRNVVGGEGAEFSLVFPSEDFAGLEDPSPGMDELMMEAYGEARLQEIFQGWMSGIEDTRTSLLVLRRDLSMSMAGGG